jgi:hypothetical protein
MNETQRTQLDVLNQKVVDGEELNELQKQLRSELSALQQQTGNSFADLRRLFHTLSQIYYFWLDFAHINLIKSLCLSMSHFISTIIIHHTVLRRMFHKLPIIDR